MSAVSPTCAIPFATPGCVRSARRAAGPAAAARPCYDFGRLALPSRPIRPVSVSQPARLCSRSSTQTCASASIPADFPRLEDDGRPATEEPSWWQRLVARCAQAACFVVMIFAFVPGMANAANDRSSGRMGGTAFTKTTTSYNKTSTSYSPGPPAKSFQGTPVTASPTTTMTTAQSTSTAAVAAPAASTKTTTNTTTKNTTVNNTTVVNNSGPANVHHHHTTVVHAAPEPSLGTVMAAAATHAVISSALAPPVVVAPVMAAPVMAPVMAPSMMGAGVVAPVAAVAPVAPVVVTRAPMFGASNLVMAGVAVGLGLAVLMVVMSRRGDKSESW